MSSNGAGARSPAATEGGRIDGTTGGYPIDRSPARLSVVVAVTAAFLAVLSLPSVVSVALGVPGAVLLGTGALRGKRRHVTYGTIGLLLGTAVAGAQGAGASRVIPPGLLSVLAWDVGRYAITIGEQLGRKADTRRIEVVHATLTATIGAAGAGVAYATYLLVESDQPVVVLALLLFGGLVIVSTLR